MKIASNIQYILITVTYIQSISFCLNINNIMTTEFNFQDFVYQDNVNDLTKKTKYYNEVDQICIKRSIGLPEKYKSPNNLEKQLRCLLIGHNPSQRAWDDGHYYSNPSNRMWSILRDTKIIPNHFTFKHDDECPYLLGIGFTDLGFGIPETKSNLISDETANEWRHDLYKRIINHMKRCYESDEDNKSHNDNKDNEDNEDNVDNVDNKTKSYYDYYPKILAFTGVRQWKALFPKEYKKRSLQETSGKSTYGIQLIRPIDWPKELNQSIVFLLPSTSGAAAMSNEIRINPYHELAELLQTIPWNT